MRLVVLGSGTSFGVPVIGCDCRVCRSEDPRDHRTRVAAVIEGNDGRRVLIDTPPELRLQLVREGIDGVDAVLYTHDHADHVHGIDDLRALSVRRGRVDVYGPPDAIERIAARFPYIFDERVAPPPGTSKPELCAAPLPPGAEVEIAGVPILPLELDHGGTPVYGYRAGAVAYLTDVKSVPQHAMDSLKGVRFLVINALFEKPHPTHLSIGEAVEIARRLEVEAAYLTHLTHRYSHEALRNRLPEGVEPAYDGLVISF
ncbi:MAG: MBL fold metallo-hydrolase [Gemmatimonadales bacterium]